MTQPLDILGLTASEFQRAASQRLASGAGVAPILYRQVMREGRFDPAALDLPPRSVAGFREHFCLDLPEVVRREAEPAAVGGEVVKLVLRRGDGREYECVRIPMGEERSHLCVSSQIGCRMACRFCETGRMGFLADLSAAEIVAQVLLARAQGWSPGGIVFMGMGEPLDNADALIQALRVLHDRQGLGYGQESLTVCTVGHVAGLRKLAALRWKRLNLTLSLHAADDELRSRLLPVAQRRWPLAAVQAALVEYRQRENFQLGVNYCLLPGVNDRPEELAAVAAFCAPLGRVMVYLVPYNPGSQPIARAPTAAEVDRCVALLRDAGLRVRRRVTKGARVMAACGQLGTLPEPRRDPISGTA